MSDPFDLTIVIDSKKNMLDRISQENLFSVTAGRDDCNTLLIFIIEIVLESPLGNGLLNSTCLLGHYVVTFLHNV